MTTEITAGKLVIFDKDGCLCKSVTEKKSGKTHAPNRLEDQEYFDDVAPICKELIEQGNTLAIASNQGGVAFGIFSADEAELLVSSAAAYIGAAAHRVCFYHPKGHVAPWNMEHRNRKPQPGMLIELMQQLNFTPANTIMVGDWKSDQEAAQAAGCGFIWAHEFFGRVNPFADRFHAALNVK